MSRSLAWLIAFVAVAVAAHQTVLHLADERDLVACCPGWGAKP